MKRFTILLKLEYDGVFLPLCVIIALMAILQSSLFGWRLRGARGHEPLAYFIDVGGIPIVFAIAFAGLLGLIAARLVMNFMPSKSIYALLTLPIKRKQIYMAKLLSVALAGFVLLAAQMALILVFHMLLGGQEPESIWLQYPRRNADLYLSLLDSGFLRMVFPPDILSLLFALAGFFGSICVTFYVAVAVKAGCKWHGILAALIWLGLLLFTFPITDSARWVNNFRFLLMIGISVAATVKGIRLFESGEVAR